MIVLKIFFVVVSVQVVVIVIVLTLLLVLDTALDKHWTFIICHEMFLWGEWLTVVKKGLLYK